MKLSEFHWIEWLLALAIILVLISIGSCHTIKAQIAATEFSTNRPPLAFTAAGGSQGFYFDTNFCWSTSITVTGRPAHYRTHWSPNLVNWYLMDGTYSKLQTDLIIVLPSPTNYNKAFFRLVESL